MKIVEKLESVKVYCPNCPMPHNLSSVDVGKILDFIVERDAEALGEGVEPYNVEHPHYEKFVEQYNIEEALRSEIKERLNESLRSE